MQIIFSFGPARSRRGRFVALLLFALLFLDRAVAQRNVVVVRPKEINDVLVNPGMGITTFQRFNGQEPNPPLKWSEVGPEKKLPQTPAKPDFPDYVRFLLPLVLECSGTNARKI